MATESTPYEETVTEIEESFGLVPGYLEALPEQELVNEWPNLRRFLFEDNGIDPKTREFVGLAVAAAIGCEYCRHFHKSAAEFHGATEAGLAELSFLASYTPRYSALIQAQNYDIGTFYEETDGSRTTYSETWRTDRWTHTNSTARRPNRTAGSSSNPRTRGRRSNWRETTCGRSTGRSTPATSSGRSTCRSCRPIPPANRLQS